MCGRCTFASPKCVQQISYISFEIARVASINRQVCAITGKPRPAGVLQKAKEVVEHLATCSRFTPDLHFGAAAALQGGGDRNSLTWLSWVPAQPKGSRVCHAQQQRRGTCGIRQPKLHSLPLLPAPCYPLHNSLSHFLYASTVC